MSLGFKKLCNCLLTKVVCSKLLGSVLLAFVEDDVVVVVELVFDSNGLLWQLPLLSNRTKSTASKLSLGVTTGAQLELVWDISSESRFSFMLFG